MARGIDEVQGKLLPLAVGVRQGHGLALDGDAALALDIHIVEDLIAKLAVVHQACMLNQAVGQGGFAMIDVGYNAEISYVFHI